ncbi:neuropeptide SIFamide receptor-like [Haliotis asinina]|uniref:neuropeptide SIFamide receptor-like n=1 Tax=Haliotis asinina TaxID=109174 RepID=UPI003531C77E
MEITTLTTLAENTTTPDNWTDLSERLFYPLLKQPTYMVTILTLAYGTVFILAVLGNTSVIAVIYRDRRFHTVTYVLLANLAVADVMVAVFCLPITLMTNLFNDWLFGALLCKLVPYLQGVSVCASVNTLAAIAIDRYIAICHVLEFKLTMRSARFTVAVVWTLAASIMIPWIIYYQQIEYRTELQVLYICFPEWPRPEQAQEFFLAIFLFCYIFPLLLIVICYSMIGLKVWNRDLGGVCSENVVIHRSKVRVAKMLGIVVLLFALSWMPLYAINIKLSFNSPGMHSEEMRIIQDLIIPMAQWLGSSNCCMNPLVYCLFSKRMRARIRIMLTCSSLIRTRRKLLKRYYSSTKHMTVDYSNGQIKLAFKRTQLNGSDDRFSKLSSDTPKVLERHRMYNL